MPSIAKAFALLIIIVALFVLTAIATHGTGSIKAIRFWPDFLKPSKIEITPLPSPKF